jgi:iron(III) transport system ATP-binding protein|tara:strand:- start:353 stop:1420 length:1068 start_codon:yes stop_codon:yes gene_type:complete
LEKYALELKNIYHEFETSIAVNDVSISIEQGEVVCLLGPSGCGKSTTLRLAAGLEKVQSGEIFLSGNLVSSVNSQVPPEQRDVGLVFQDYALFPHLSVIENTKFGLKKLSQKIAERRALDALKMVNMDSYSQNYPHTLSGGEQQRVALARAMAPKPKVMLLDEPYSGLDARLRDNIRDEVLHLLKANECATLMVTHDSEEAMFMADRIVVMQEGQIIQTGKPEELYCNPINAFVAGFFGELNFVDGVVVEKGVNSDLGLLPSRDFKIGDKVEVVARPEALSIREETCINEEKKAVVVESRLLGRSSLIHLSLPIHSTGKNKSKHLHARVPGVVLPRPGSIVGVELDLSQVFVFKK